MVQLSVKEDEVATTKSAARDLVELEAVVDALPNYLNRSHLYTSIPSPADPSHSLPVSVGTAQDRVSALKARGDLTAEQQVELAGLEGRMEATRRLYPKEWDEKLASEMRSRTNVARQAAEED